MSYWLFAGGILSALTAIVHSALGEALIFRYLRSKGVVPDLAMPPLPPRRTGILWATWHLASVFGLAFSAMLFAAALQPPAAPGANVALMAISIANLLASLLVLIGTGGRHPGWVALLAVSAIAGVASLA